MRYLLSIIVALVASTASAADWEIVDCTSSTVTGKPDLQAAYGITDAVVLYHGTLFPVCRHHPEQSHRYGDWLDEKRVRKAIRQHPPGTTFILNLEGPPCDAWGKQPWQWYTHDPKTHKLVPENLDRLIRAVKFCRAVEPRNRWSVYGHTPGFGWNDWKQEWWRRTVRDCKPLADELDFCSVVFYLSAESIVDPANKEKSYFWLEHPTHEWTAAMRHVLASCRAAYQTPVYAWVWPEYYLPHWRFRRSKDSDTGDQPYLLFADRQMPSEVWRQVIAAARGHADGICVWGLAGSAPEFAIEWDERWSWWNVIRGHTVENER